MSATRLLVLGAVRILQPAHGYLVMRELGTWKVDDWAKLKPGSIYNALRSLTKGGLLTEVREPDDRSGTKAVYRLTHDGEAEFERLVRQAIWQLHPWEPEVLSAGISFWTALTREEVLEALEGRRAQLVAWLSSNRYAEDSIARNPATPSHVAEHFKLAGARMQGELVWTEDVARRVKDGAYYFRGETGDPFHPTPDPAAD